MTPGRTLIVIPARWGSQRLPGKPLRLLAGQPMMTWVVRAALQVRNASGVVVATDHPEIAAVARQAGAEVALTSRELQNGTERLIAVIGDHPAENYINLQGDEPLIAPEDVERLIEHLDEVSADVISLRHSVDPGLALEASRVKVVCRRDGRALYFSRSPIPHGASQFWQHVGIYGFRASALKAIAQLGPTALESQENLEQLRWLEAGLSIQLIESVQPSLGVDTEEDLRRVEQVLRLRQVQALVCDVDGVLTDGRLWYSSDGEQLKAFHARDGLAIKVLMQQGIQVALVSGRDSEPLRRRISDLGLTHVRLGEPDKAKACTNLASDMGLELEALAYVGDDTLDLPGMECCGWSFAVADAPEAVRRSAGHVLHCRGGGGAIREVAELLLTARHQQSVLEQGNAFQATGLHQQGRIQ